MSKQYPIKLTELPTTEHYVILTEFSFSYDDGYGDGRPSISNHSSFSYQVKDTLSEVEVWVKQNLDKKFKIMKVTPVPFNIETNVKINFS